MGLLKGLGPRLKGLFGEGGLPDVLAEAQAYLDGDYERAAVMAGQRRRDRKGIQKVQMKPPLADGFLDPGLQYDGLLIDLPQMRMGRSERGWG